MRVEEHTITLDQAPVFYRSASASGIATVYLHGAPTSSLDWIPFLERTGGIAPDLLGFGRSSKGGHHDYSLEGLVGFVAALLAELQLERVRLVSHDWGGAIALLLAGRQPERIERLLLMNAVPLAAGFRWHPVARLWRRRLIGELAMGATPRWLLARELRRGSAGWSEAQIDAVWEQFDQGTQRAILRLYRSADERHLARAGASLPVLAMPALVLWGELDPWLPVTLASRIAAPMPHAGLERVAGAGHWPWLDQRSVVERVVAFLEE